MPYENFADWAEYFVKSNISRQFIYDCISYLSHQKFRFLTHSTISNSPAHHKILIQDFFLLLRYCFFLLSFSFLFAIYTNLIISKQFWPNCHVCWLFEGAIRLQFEIRLVSTQILIEFREIARLVRRSHLFITKKKKYRSKAKDIFFLAAERNRKTKHRIFRRSIFIHLMVELKKEKRKSVGWATATDAKHRFVRCVSSMWLGHQ